MMLLIGSRAARYFFPNFPHANDWDFLGTPNDIAEWVQANAHRIARQRLRDDEHKLFITTTEGHKLEIEIVKPGSSSDMFLKAGWCKLYTAKEVLDCDYYVADPTVLMLIKLSHLRHPIKWRKNIEDYHFFKKYIDRHREIYPIAASCHEEILAAYEKRRAEVASRFKEREINLNMKNEDFFKKSGGKVKRFYEHDDLHLATCYYGVPLYETLKQDKSKAIIDKGLWSSLSHEDKLRTVREECYAIALERKIIPTMNAGQKFDDEEAFLYALQRICTTLTKGWFREFAIEHYPEIKCVDRDYVGYFLDAVSDGKIRSVA